MEVNYYQRAGAIFAQEDNSLMAYNLFLDALKIDKNDALIWLHLGHSLISFSIETRSDNVLDKGLFCVLESNKLDKTDELIKRTIENYKGNPFLSGRIDTCPNFTFEEIEVLKQDIQEEHLIVFFNAIKSLDDKIALLIYLGETKDQKFYPLLKYCLENTDNQHVKFAALKRIHFFVENEDLKNIFEKIISQDKREDYEPYFTMALRKIDKDWSEELIEESNDISSKADEIIGLISKDLQNDIINEDYLDAMIYTSLSRYEFSEMKKFINQKDSMMLIVCLLGEFPKVGQELFYKSDVIKNGEITEFGWKKMNEYVQKQISSENQSEILKENAHNEGGKVKWWQIWKQ